MPEILLPAAYYTADQDPRHGVPPLVQRHSCNTIIEDDSLIPQYYLSSRLSPTSTISGYHYPIGLSPNDNEEFPTPKARIFDMLKPSPQPSPMLQRPSSLLSQHRVSRTGSDFDSLYDITDDEAEVPLKCSASVKQVATSNRSSRNRYPSLVIPSPSAWPTIEKLKSAMSAVPPTPSQLLTPSQQALSSLASRSLKVPETSATPSLDGSLTSEEMEQLSCPTTPETQNRESVASVDDWGPVQLDNQALETLHHLGFSSDSQHESQAAQVIEARDGEMREVSRRSLGLTIPSTQQSSSSGNTPVSELSIPSPGGFFSSLHSTARHTWSMPRRKEDSVPNTSTAERFYQLPFDSRRNTIAQQTITIPEQTVTLPEQTVTLAGSTLDGYTDGLPTSRPVVLGESDDTLEIKEINPSKTLFQYNERYHAELQKIAVVNLERTGHWLDEQDELQAALRDMNEIGSPSLSSSSSHSRGNSIDKVVKKSVRFIEEPKDSPTDDGKPKKTTTYIQGFEFLRERSRRNDPYIHRQTRAEAMHIHRRCLPQSHRDALLGKFELTNPVRPSPPRPVSEFYTDDPTALKERIARAQMERQALDQILPITWVLQALKQLNGGKLLSKPATKNVAKTRAPRILDIGGVPTNDWAWKASYDYPYSVVTTVYTAGNNLSSDVSGPENHKHMPVPNLWTLPFPNAHFDVISARSLYELLKTDKPLGRSMDEYDLCLKECFRCLKPGGILDFTLLDADVIKAGRHAQAMGVEFGFNLKTRGYDAAPTKSFIPRLRKAGFTDVQRAWIVLPMGKTAANWRDVLPVGVDMKQEEKSISPGGAVAVHDAPIFGTTVDAAMMTGIVGSWAWERWMLKLQLEMGKEEEELLKGVVQVLEEGAIVGSGWRYLMGYARKKA